MPYQKLRSIGEKYERNAKFSHSMMCLSLRTVPILESVPFFLCENITKVGVTQSNSLKDRRFNANTPKR